MANVTFPFPFPDNLITLLPEMLVAIAAMALLLIDVFITRGSKVTAYLAIATALIAAVVTWSMQDSAGVTAFYGYFVFDSFAIYSKLLIFIGTAFGMLLSLEYMKDEVNIGEYYVLMLFAMLGMMLMVSANNFIIMYLGLELMALSIYVLVAYQREVLRSNEAALKYFILGALSSGMLLYGVTFLYGVTGSFHFAEMGQALLNADADSSHAAVMLGLVFLIAGLGFKVSMAPFHMWTPDAYEGAPTPVTAFMSVAPKVAGFAILIRIVHDLLPAVQVEYETILSILAVLTIAVGNLAAIAQRNIKRMLAYSTVGHVGFIMMGLIAGTEDGFSGILVYLSIYLIMTMGVFAVIILMRRDGIQGELLDDFAGLSKVRPGYALAMGLLLFSMAGIPFLGGFWAKFVVFKAAYDAGHLYLVVFALLISAVGAFYYLRVVKYIYFDEERVAFDFVETQPLRATVVVAAIGVVWIGLFPNPLMDMCKQALAGLI